MKLKLIKDSEVVVGRTAFNTVYEIASGCQELNLAISQGKASYYMHEYFGQGVYWVKVKFRSLELPVKIFNSPDPDYNRVCAEELVELLNQEQ